MAVESSMLALGTPAPSFTLPQPATGATVSLDELTGPALVVTFICNHCPYVQHVAAGLATLGRDLADQGVPMVGISSNDVVTYPQDGPAAEHLRHVRSGCSVDGRREGVDRGQRVAEQRPHVPAVARRRRGVAVGFYRRNQRDQALFGFDEV